MSPTSLKDSRSLIGMGRDWFGFVFSRGCNGVGEIHIQPMENVKVPVSQTVFLHIVIGLFFVPLIWALVYAFLPAEDRFRWYGENEIIPPIVEPGEIVVIRRTFSVTEPTSVSIKRELIKVNGETTTRIELPSVNHHYEAGDHKQERPFIIPCTASDGKWTLSNEVVYMDQLGRTKTQYPPKLTVTIYGTC